MKMLMFFKSTIVANNIKVRVDWKAFLTDNSNLKFHYNSKEYFYAAYQITSTLQWHIIKGDSHRMPFSKVILLFLF